MELYSFNYIKKFIEDFANTRKQEAKTAMDKFYEHDALDEFNGIMIGFYDPNTISRFEITESDLFWNFITTDKRFVDKFQVQKFSLYDGEANGVYIGLTNTVFVDVDNQSFSSLEFDLVKKFDMQNNELPPTFNYESIQDGKFYFYFYLRNALHFTSGRCLQISNLIDRYNKELESYIFTYDMEKIKEKKKGHI